MPLLYLRTRAGMLQAIRDARHARITYPGANYTRYVAPDGAFCFSIWRGSQCIGYLSPTR